MAEINVNSWHHRLIENLNLDASSNLCIYFWQVILAMLLLVALVIFATNIFIMFLACLGIYWAFVFGFSVPFNAAILSGIFNAFVFCTFAIGAFRASDKGEEILERYEVRKEKKEPSLLISYIKAKKEKVCPRIEFVNK